MDELEGRDKRGKREGEDGLCELPDMGGSRGEAMGNPQGNPGITE